MSNFLELAQTLQMAIKALQMYTPAHPRSQEALKTLAASIADWHRDRPELHMSASSGKVFVDGNPVEGVSLHLTSLVRQLTERQISGFLIQRGVPPEELLAMLEVLILKPAKLEERGGVAQVLASKNLRYITLSQVQYREVREGEGGEEDHGGAERGKESGGSDAAPEPAPQIPDIVTAPLIAGIAEALKQWKEQLLAATSTPPEHRSAGNDPYDGWSIPDGAPDQGLGVGLGLSSSPGFSNSIFPANLGNLGRQAEEAGWGEGFPTASQIEALRRALQDLPADTRLSIVKGLDSLPRIPAGLRMGFQALAPEVLAQASAELLSEGVPWQNLKGALFDILRASPQRQVMMTGLEVSLGKQGLSHGQIQELMRQLDWDGQSLEEKIRRALEDQRLWDLSLEQRLSFLRELLDQGRMDPFLRILDLILEALTSEDPVLREAAARTMAGITHWSCDPGLPLEAEGPILQGLTAHFGWEPISNIHRSTEEGLEAILDCLIRRGEVAQAQGLIQELDGLCSFMEDKQAWREQALERLIARLVLPEAISGALGALYKAEPEELLTLFVPYFEFLGEPGASELVRLLGEEPDRKRRGRLLEVIRALGPLALSALYRGLQSPTWYLVRNTLNLLAEMGDAGILDEVASCLQHEDGRVKRAAVRALWKLGGPACAPHLLPIFAGVDPDTQLEILFGLGHVQSASAVPVLSEFLRNTSAPERVRIKTAETLGQIGHPGAVQALVDLIRRKGRIFTSAEPTELRLAAARALMAIGTAPAQASLQRLVQDEPRSKDRDALQQILDNPRT